MLKAAGTVVLLVMLGACASQGARRIVYEKPGAVDADRKRDQAQCATASVGPRHYSMIGAMRFDRDLFDACMKGRGYTIRVRPS